MTDQQFRLTTLSHGGGCGCKIAPAVLSEMLSALPAPFTDPNLLVGTENSDDAAVYKIGDGQAVVASTDFFMPIVDDPFDFGRIAATNALSDIYATGARPILALAILGVPLDKMLFEAVGEVLAGGAAACREAGIAVAGGHSIDSPEPIYGLAAVGLADLTAIRRNDTAQEDDLLILGKALGVGILGAALKKGELGDAGYKEMLKVTTRLNSVGVHLGEIAGVHGMTDVTGFGLLGHLLEVCRGSGLSAVLDIDNLPILPTALELAEAGHNTGAAGRNWQSYGHEVTLPQGLPQWRQNLLCDPQTSGGLLVSCAPSAADQVLDLFHGQGHGDAAVIGTMSVGVPGVVVKA